MANKNTSKEWQRIFPNPKVLDPDGWNRDERFDYEWNEQLITFDEYKHRVLSSTCEFHKGRGDFMTEDELAISRGQP